MKQILILTLLLAGFYSNGQAVINSISPSGGPVGTEVIITGVFDPQLANNTVFFGTINAPVISGSQSELRVNVPPGAVYERISVQSGVFITQYDLPFIVPFGGSGVAENSFAAPVEFATGNDPIHLITGDLDGDGKSDALVINVTDRTISIFRNSSTGSGSIDFETQGTISVGTASIRTALGDLDGDGKTDLIVPNGGLISVYRNISTSGTINFEAKGDFWGGSLVGSAKIGDMDGDGRLDIVALKTQKDSVAVFLNTSSGIGSIDFGSHINFPQTSGQSDLGIADFDFDGKLDVAVSNSDIDVVSFLRNTSTGAGNINFVQAGSVSTGAWPEEVEVGDFDGDGRMDFAVANHNGHSVSVFRNSRMMSGGIDFDNKIDLSTGDDPRAIDVDDIDGDGKPDIVALNYNPLQPSNGKVVVFRNLSPGSIAFDGRFEFTISQAGPKEPGFVSVADLDLDSRPDLVITNISGKRLAVLRNLTEKPFKEVLQGTFTSIESASAIAPADYDNDGDYDVLILGWTGTESKTELYDNNGDGTFSLNASVNFTNVFAGDAEWVDFDRDGHLDVLIMGDDEDQSASTGLTRLYRNDGNKLFTEAFAGTFIDVRSGDASWGDINNDGLPDLLLFGEEQEGSGSKLVTRLYENDGENGFADITPNSLDDLFQGMGEWFDYDKDGQIDLMLSGLGNDVAIARLFRNINGDPVEVQAGVFTPVNAGLVGIVDYDNDGLEDVLLAGRQGDITATELYRNASGSNFSKQATIFQGIWSGSVAWGDLNNDGNADLLTSGADVDSNPHTNLYSGGGDGTFQIFAEDEIPDARWGSIRPFDFDTDGDMDIMLIGQGTSLFENTIAVSNTPPNEPVNLSVSATTTSLTINWDAATDNETPSPGLTYDLYITDLTTGKMVVAAPADTTNGFRRVVKRGRIKNLTWTLKESLPSGNYRIGVQAVDQSYTGSDFAVTHFVMTENPTNPPTAISLSNNTAIRNSPEGTRIGFFTTEDLDVGDVFTYTLVQGSAGGFQISGNNLTFSADGPAEGDHSIEIQSSDGRESVSVNFDITIVEPSLNNILTPGTSVENYRIFGVPTDQVRIDQVFPELSSTEPDSSWRIVSYANGSNIQHVASDNLIAGKGYWYLNNNSTTEDISILSPITLNADFEFGLALSEGWNLISNPFLGSISWTDIISYNISQGVVGTGDLSDGIYTYNGSYNISTSLNVFEGGWVMSENSVTLRLPNPGAVTNSGRAAKTNPFPMNESWFKNASNWQLLLELRSADRVSNLAGIGMRTNAREGQDNYDLSVPPPISSDAAFQLIDKSGLTRNYTSPTSDHEWSFNIEAPKYQNVTISWDREVVYELQRNLFLYVAEWHKTFNMREIDKLSVPVNSGIRIIYGNNYDSKTLDLEVNANPNPATGNVSFEFFLSGSKPSFEVSASIFDLSGQPVYKKTEVKFVNQKGYIHMENIPLPPGLYLYRISYDEGKSRFKKLILR